MREVPAAEIVDAIHCGNRNVLSVCSIPFWKYTSADEFFAESSGLLVEMQNCEIIYKRPQDLSLLGNRGILKLLQHNVRDHSFEVR